MNFLIAQIVLAARSTDPENAPWIKLLIFVIIAVIAAIQGIAKKKANKTEFEDDEQNEKTFTRPKPKTRVQISVQKNYITAKQQIRPYITRQIDETEFEKPITVPVAKKPVFSELQPFAESPKEIRKEPLAAPAAISQLATAPVEAFLRFDGLDELKTAIIYYEIIGKPLALREPTGHLIAF